MPRPKGSKNKPKAGAKAQETLQETMDIRFTSEKDLNGIVRRLKTYEAAKNEAVGEMGQIVSDAVEKKHLHKRAFAIARRLLRLEDQELAITLAHLDQYLEDLGIRERATAQAQMFKLADSITGPKDEPEGENVTVGSFRRKQREADAEAGAA